MRNHSYSLFLRYVSQNILGMLGVSCYILADTFFISRSGGSDGITVLNLCLPIYSLIFALGQMIGIGGASRFSLLRGLGRREAGDYFSQCILWGSLIGILLGLTGFLIPDVILRLMGGDPQIIAAGISYARIFMTCSPAFILNYIVTAFVRNDSDPTLAMSATLLASLFNIIFDYIFMFPMHMGMAGAALATSMSPMVSILICLPHFRKKINTLHLKRKSLSLRFLFSSCQLGTAAFVGEFSSAVLTTTFNFLILNLAGNLGVAAYGIIANLALVATAIFNGIAQGAQPLFSDTYGKGDQEACRRILYLGLGTALLFSVLLYGLVFLFSAPLVQIFNSEGSSRLADYAFTGLRLYFAGFFFAGFNIVVTGYLSATGQAMISAISSFLRGLVLIILCAVLLSLLFGLNGIWSAFAAAELLALPVSLYGILHQKEAKS